MVSAWNPDQGSSRAAEFAGAQAVEIPGSYTQSVMYGNGWAEPQPPHLLGG